ncbi:uncharacterized protein AB675_5076 [Cyphellophora attinorum]|uniref:SnoaL-like domain-containing protein n=1 Tax=Cyphellophora attinorum TaxID=1664694 RepID=A0A0N1HSY9_9EURO|nr:uncharacterized protein AB675_5076 [Phialophora attinorum]KPI39487.1 hypothetical protein AB675_5076 [Phialophora attinorum]
MVNIKLGGFPNIVIDPNDENPIREAKGRIRQKMKGGGMQVSWRTEARHARLIIASDTDEFDEDIINHFHFQNTLSHAADNLELGENYAIVAYGDAATLCLEAAIHPMPKLAAVVAYYPPYMPRTSTGWPRTLPVMVHLASSQNFGTTLDSYTYQDTVEGFAEHDLDEYDKTAARVSWSRTLRILRRAFSMEDHWDLEAIWDNHTKLEFDTKDAEATMKTMVREPYVNHIPTMTGGIGARELFRFYDEFFIPNNPETMKLKLLSRTVGVDRVVDEMLVSFRHTTEIPWMLPGIPPTDRQVEVILVSVVCIRGGRLYHEHIHWDQATVLVQVGLLDPKLIPDTFKTTEKGREKEVKQLPVCGKEAARKGVNEKDGRSNQLIPGWSTSGGRGHKAANDSSSRPSSEQKQQKSDKANEGSNLDAKTKGDAKPSDKQEDSNNSKNA